MKILYGVVGEGMGHATRSRVVLDHLRARGHDLRIVASHGAATFLDRHFGTVLPIDGMKMVFDSSNRVCRLRTAASIFTKGLLGLPRNVQAYFQLIHDGFEPDVVISDFESWSHLYGMLHGIPVISLDNIQIVGRCKLPDEVVDGRRWDYLLNKMLVRSKLPFCDRYLLTSFFKPEVTSADTSIHAPILRREILDAKPVRGDHVVVYQSGGVDSRLVDSLRASGVECRTYGLVRGDESNCTDGNLVHRRFDEAAFIEDLRTSRAVVATGGASLMSEAIHLGKPVLATPIAGQFEQNMNSIYLEKLGFGRIARGFTQDTVRDFLSEESRYEDALGAYDRVGNHDLLRALDRELATVDVDVREGGASWASVA